MSLLKTKPRWAPTAVATNRGWQDPVTGEVYVAIGNLKTLLEEQGLSEEAPKKERKKREKKQVEQKVEDTMAVETPTKEVVAETTEVVLKKDQKIIGEVVEQDPSAEVLGE